MNQSNSLKAYIQQAVSNIKLINDIVFVEEHETNKYIWSQNDVMLPFIVSYANILYKEIHNINYLKIKYKKTSDSLHPNHCSNKAICSMVGETLNL